MAKPPSTPEAPSAARAARFTTMLGAFLGLGLLKFGNPVIIDRLIEPPKDWLELLVQAWPVAWGYFIGAALVLWALAQGLIRAAKLPRIAWLPLAWLGWQFIAALGTMDAKLSTATLLHFTALTAAFYLGFLVLDRGLTAWRLWPGLLAGLLFVIWAGLDQHFGGLEATRKYFYSQPNWQQFPPEYLKRIESNRIFATLAYPNTFAGVLLLLLPAGALATAHFTRWLTLPSRVFLAGVVGAGGLACLYWTGSKAGWLIALGMGAVALWRWLRLPVWLKRAVVIALCVAGVAGFWYKYQSYFERGATSVGARFDYWQSAARTFVKHPLLGSGPGTFGQAYSRDPLKPPQAEPTRLVHNDYLEQASDSGAVGCALYAALVIGGLARAARGARRDPLRGCVWLGLLGWALQGFVEFGLYIPAISWTAFLLLGWLNAEPPTPPGVAGKTTADVSTPNRK